MKVSTSKEEASGFIQLFEYFETLEAKQAFAYFTLAFSHLSNGALEFEQHGAVSSLRVRVNDDWMFSFCAAKDWVLAYIRPPAIERLGYSIEELKTILPDAKIPQDSHLSVRIYSVEQAKAFQEFIFEKLQH